VLPASGDTPLFDLKKQFYKTTGQYRRHQGKLLTKVAPKYYEVRVLADLPASSSCVEVDDTVAIFHIESRFQGHDVICKWLQAFDRLLCCSSSRENSIVVCC